MKKLILNLTMVFFSSFFSPTSAFSFDTVGRHELHAEVAWYLERGLDGRGYFRINKFDSKQRQPVGKSSNHVDFAVPVTVDFIRSGRPAPRTKDEIAKIIMAIGDDTGFNNLLIQLFKSSPGTEFKGIKIYTYVRKFQESNKELYVGTSFQLREVPLVW